MKLLRAVHEEQLPSPDGYGRTLRVTIDIDMNAVHDYVFCHPDSVSWPIALMEEMTDRIAEVARREAAVQMMLAGR